MAENIRENHFFLDGIMRFGKWRFAGLSKNLEIPENRKKRRKKGSPSWGIKTGLSKNDRRAVEGRETLNWG